MKTYDETDAFICACKGEPYTSEEWDREVERLESQLTDARARAEIARKDGVCMPLRFDSAGPAL